MSILSPCSLRGRGWFRADVRPAIASDPGHSSAVSIWPILGQSKPVASAEAFAEMFSFH